MEALWRRPLASGNEGATEVMHETRRLSWVKLNALLTLGLLLLWGLRIAGMMPFFWLLAVVIAWPIADQLTRRSVEHLLRPPGTTEVPSVPSLTTVFLERGLRVALVIGALAILAWGWGIDIESLTANETMMNRFARGILSAVAIALIADFVWHVAKAAIDMKLAETAERGHTNTRRGAAPGALAHVVANFSQHAVCRRGCCCCDDGAFGNGR